VTDRTDSANIALFGNYLAASFVVLAKATPAPISFDPQLIASPQQTFATQPQHVRTSLAPAPSLGLPQPPQRVRNRTQRGREIIGFCLRAGEPPATE
jgi:hypothetical protein